MSDADTLLLVSPPPVCCGEGCGVVLVIAMITVMPLIEAVAVWLCRR